jgi:hypothetical protein
MVGKCIIEFWKWHLIEDIRTAGQMLSVICFILFTLLMMEKESYTRTLLQFKLNFLYFPHVPTDAVFINYFSITIVELNLQTGRPACMSFTLEGRGEHYV